MPIISGHMDRNDYSDCHMIGNRGNIATMNVKDSKNGDTVVLRIIDTVARRLDCDPMDLRPVASYIDPDAVERLVASAQGELEVQFRMDDCRVTVDEHGRVTAVLEVA